VFVCRYYANWTEPRPESYREDVETALNATGSSDPSNPAAAALYRELASGAESGWDYSSRWFADNATLGTIRTTQVTVHCSLRLFELDGIQKGFS
jgi:alpha,alpha-trehalase